MRRLKIVFTLALITIIFSAGALCAYASERYPRHSSLGTNNIVAGLFLDHHEKHENHVYIVLKEQLKLTDTEILEAQKAGKTAFDLAKSKGVSEEKLKVMIYEEKCKSLDNNVKDGKLTKEKAEKIKLRYKEKLEKWDGKLKTDEGKHEHHHDKHYDNEKKSESND